MQNGSLTRDIPSVGTLVGLLLLLCYPKLATIEQLMWPKRTTRLGLLLAHRQRGRARTAVPTPPQIALRGFCGSFPAVDDQHVAMMLTWPWWSQEGSLLTGMRRIGHSPKKEDLVFFVTLQ